MQPEGQGTEARLSSLYSDARTVYLHLLAPPALEDRLPAIDESWGDFGTDTGQQLEETLPKVNLHTFYIGRLDDFKTFLGKLRAPRRNAPTLNYLHVLMPHGPWLYFPDGRVRAVASPRAPGRKGDLWTYEPLAQQAWQRHLLQVGYTDVLLGRLIDRLQQTGLWDKALIVVTADEGDSFRGGDFRRNPSKTNLSTVAFIPLFVKLPGQTRGRVIDRRVTTVDILPTIADVLGVKVPWRLDGSSALPPARALGRREHGSSPPVHRPGAGGRRGGGSGRLRGFGGGPQGPPPRRRAAGGGTDPEPPRIAAAPKHPRRRESTVAPAGTGLRRGAAAADPRIPARPDRSRKLMGRERAGWAI